MVETTQIKTAIIEELSIITGARVSVNTDLVEKLGFDSFGTMQLLAFLEDTYGIEVPDELLAIENFSSVEVIMQWMETLER